MCGLWRRYIVILEVETVRREDMGGYSSWKNKDFWLYSGKTRILSSNNNKTRPIDLKDPEEILTLRLFRYP